MAPPRHISASYFLHIILDIGLKKLRPTGRLLVQKTRRPNTAEYSLVECAICLTEKKPPLQAVPSTGYISLAGAPFYVTLIYM